MICLSTSSTNALHVLGVREEHGEAHAVNAIHNIYAHTSTRSDKRSRKINSILPVRKTCHDYGTLHSAAQKQEVCGHLECTLTEAAGEVLMHRERNQHKLYAGQRAPHLNDQKAQVGYRAVQ